MQKTTGPKTDPFGTPYLTLFFLFFFFRRVATTNKDTLYFIFKVWTEKGNEFKLYK